MKSLLFPMLAATAALLCAPQADAGRRDPSVPIIVTPPAGSITVHMESPEPSASPVFNRTRVSERTRTRVPERALQPTLSSKRKLKS